MKISYRTFQPDDVDGIIELFRDTVRSVNAKDYTPEQIEAWAPEDFDNNHWKRRLERNYSVVAINGSRIVGFGELSLKGIIDSLYVHKDYLKKGIGSAILEALEDEAYAREYRLLKAEVSLTAKPFFLSHNYVITEEQEKLFNGQWFVNLKMEKKLNYT